MSYSSKVLKVCELESSLLKSIHKIESNGDGTFDVEFDYGQFRVNDADEFETFTKGELLDTLDTIRNFILEN